MVGDLGDIRYLVGLASLIAVFSLVRGREMSEGRLRMIIKLSSSLLDYTFAANLAYKKNT